MSGPSHSPIDRAVAQLETHWRSSHRLRLSLTSTITGCTALIVLCALDRALTPSGLARGALLCTAAVFVVAIHTWRARSARPRRDDLARWLAHANDGDPDLMRSAADFARRESHHCDDGESAALRAAVLSQAADAAAHVPNPRIPWRLLGVAAVIAISVTGFVLSDRAAAFVSARRVILLSNETYPARSRMFLVDRDPKTPIRVVRGRGVRLVARARGEAVSDATLHRHRGEARTRVRMKRDAAGAFVAVLDAVLMDETVFVTGGDDVDARPAYRLEVAHPPAVAALTATECFPAYTGRAPRRIATSGWALLDGSAVEVLVRTDRPVATARIVLGEAGHGARLISMTPGGETTFRARVEPDGARQYAIVLVDHDGLDNAPAPVHGIRYRPDRPPRITWRGPQVDGLVTPNAVLPIAVDARDDFGVRSAIVHVYPEGAADRGDRSPLPVAEPMTADVALSDRRVRGPIGPRPPEVGDRLSLRVEAADGKNQRGRSTALSLVVASPPAVEARLLGAVREVARVIGEAADQLIATDRALLRAARAGDAPARTAERIARQTAVDYRGGLRGAASRLRHLGRAYAINRLPGETGVALGDAAADIDGGTRALDRIAANTTDAARPLPAPSAIGAEIRGATAQLTAARRTLARFADLRDAVRHTMRATRRHADVDRTITAIIEQSGRDAGVSVQLGAAAQGVAAVRYDMDLAGIAIGALAARPPSPLDPPGDLLRRWRDALVGRRVRKTLTGLRAALDAGRPAVAADHSRDLLRHLLALVSQMAEAAKAARESRGGTPGQRGEIDGKQLDDLLDRTSSFNRDLKDAANKRAQDLARALERLKQQSRDLEKDLRRMRTANDEDEKGAREAHPESMQRMMQRVRQRLDKGDTDGAVVISDRLLEKLKRSVRRAPSKRTEPEFGDARTERPPDPKGQNMSGEYRPESGVGGAGRTVVPGRRADGGGRLRWGVLPPARGGGTSAAVPKDAPARYRRAVEAYYRKLSEDRR